MLTRLIVHSWYTLASYTLHPGRVTLIDAADGLDPTDPIDVLEVLRDFVLQGRPAVKMFPRRSLPRSPYFSQDFTLDLGGPDGRFKYELLIEHHPRRDDACRSENEVLWHDDTSVTAYYRGRSSAEDDDWNEDPTELPPPRVDPDISVLAQLDDTLDPRLAAFKRQLARIHVVHTLAGSDPETHEQRARDELAAVIPRLQDPELTLAVVLPDVLPDAELEPFLAAAHAAHQAGPAAQLLLSAARPGLLERFKDLAQEPGPAR